MATKTTKTKYRRPNAVTFLWRRFRASEKAILLILAVLLGLASAGAIWLFRVTIEIFQRIFVEWFAFDVLGGAWGVMVGLGVAGFIVGWIMQRFVGHERYRNASMVVESTALAGGHLPYRKMPPKAFASALSIGAGASVGPEDPGVQICSHLGAFMGERMELTEKQMRLLVSAGAASAIAAAFNAPIAGVFFALEVVLNAELETESVGVIVLASVIASAFTQALQIATPPLGPFTYALNNVGEIALFVPLGLMLAPFAVAFLKLIYWQQDWWSARLQGHPMLKTAIAGVLVGLVAMFLPQIMGTGREIMNEVLRGESEFTLFLLALSIAKIWVTAVSVGGGFVGGTFAPSLFIGTMLGGLYGRTMAFINPNFSEPQVFAIAGMAGMMAGVVHAPITAIMLVFELTNDYRMILPIMLTSVVCIYLTKEMFPDGLYHHALKREGVHLQQGRDVDVMQGVKVSEAMHTPVTIDPRASLTQLRDVLHDHHTRAAGIVDDGHNLIGIVTLTDLQDAYDLPDHGVDLTVADIATYPCITASMDEPLWVAVRRMGQHEVGRLPVVESGSRKLVGMLNRHDIVRAYNLAIARKVADQHHAEQIRLQSLTGAHVFEFKIQRGAPIAEQCIQEIKWPPESVIASIQRKNKLLIPHGVTRLHADDRVTIVAAPEAERDIARLFGL